MSGTTTGSARLRILRPSGADYVLLAESNEETVLGDPSGALRRFSTSIPVAGGDVIGIRLGNSPGDLDDTFPSGASGDVAGLVVGDPNVGQSVGPSGAFGFSSASARVNIAATISRSGPVATPPASFPTTKKRKCKRHKKKRVAAAKKCKKRKKRR
jgi:hypothetical protein